MLAAIPYTTFPTIELGPLDLRTFGLMVALGVLLGAWIAAAYAEHFGVTRDETYRVATWMVLAGIIGSRLTWVATHTDQIDSPVDIIAIWEGGIQFSGGFLFALAVGLPFFKRWRKLVRWQVLDAYALGLSIGLAIGRIGCYSVGEHFGRTTDFFLASRYDGGDVREATLGDVPLVPGTTFHNTSLYELVYMLVLFAALGGVVLAARRRGRDVTPGTLIGVFVLYYGVARLASDSLRVNDERVAGMTGAQWMCLAMIPAGIWILWKVRPKLATLAATEADAAHGGEPVVAPDELEAPDVTASDDDHEPAGTDADDARAAAPAAADEPPAEEAADSNGVEAEVVDEDAVDTEVVDEEVVDAEAVAQDAVDAEAVDEDAVDGDVVDEEAVDAPDAEATVPHTKG